MFHRLFRLRPQLLNWRIAKRQFQFNQSPNGGFGQLLSVNAIERPRTPDIAHLKSVAKFIIDQFDAGDRVDALSVQYVELRCLYNETDDAIKVESDHELKEALASELDEIRSAMRDLESTLKDILSVPSLNENDEQVLVEIDAGSGGAGGATVMDLHQLYCDYCDHMGWTIDSIDTINSDSTFSNGGYQRVQMRVSGINCHHYFKLESGQHRAMRTSTSKRPSKDTIYTFIITVNVTPIIETPKVAIPSDHLKIVGVRGTGKGGMKINSTNVSAQITHLPTGLVVSHFESGNRDLEINTKIALRKLYGILQQREEQRIRDEILKIKQGNIKQGYVRTYKYKSNELNDHLTGEKGSLKHFFKNGELLAQYAMETLRRQTQAEIDEQLEHVLKQFEIIKNDELLL